MNILIAIGGKEYSKPTLDLGMKVANALEATTTIAYVGKKISQFSEKDVRLQSNMFFRKFKKVLILI